MELVTHNETFGAPFLFSEANSFGKVPFSEAACGICAVTIVHASQLDKTEISKPIFINHAPHEPTIFSKIPAVEGFGTAANSACVI